jgi:sugar-specific transcriptional regulator TrmB
MNEELLVSLGLNKTQAKAYIALVRHGAMSPPELAKATGETRTNAYTILDRLVELGLAKKDDHKKKLVYRVENPVALENLVKKHRDQALAQEKLVKDSMPALLNYFYTFSEQPGVRFFQGKDGIEEIYKDHLRTGKTTRIIRSWKDRDFFGKGVYNVWRKRPAKYGIKTVMLSPDVEDANNDPALDKLLLWTRTWMTKEDYTAPVEWDIYGDKVSIISFGEEAIGMIIESPQIAESMRQIFALAERGLRANPEYNKLPKYGRMSDEKYAEQNPEYKALLEDARKRRGTDKEA